MHQHEKDMTQNEQISKNSEQNNNKIREICQQLQYICTASCQLTCPPISKKNIKKRKKKQNRKDSEEETSDYNKKELCSKCQQQELKKLEKKMTIIDDLQNLLQSMKGMLASLE